MSTTTAPLPTPALSTARLRALARGRADDARFGLILRRVEIGGVRR